MTWIDDQFVVSGSRDGTVALWRVTEEMIEEVTRADIPSHMFGKPLMKKTCKAADRVRSLCYNHQRQEIAVISLNGYIHCWNATRFKQARRLVTTCTVQGPGGGFIKSKHCVKERFDTCLKKLSMYSGLTELLPISYTYSFTIRMDFGHVVLVWKYIVNSKYMETEMVISAARRFFRSTSALSRG
jgi:WD40 repeat protein